MGFVEISLSMILLPMIPGTSRKYELTRAPGNVKFGVGEDAFRREPRVGMEEAGGRILHKSFIYMLFLGGGWGPVW